MSNKARSRRRKEFFKLLKAVSVVVDLFNKLHKIEEKNYPKLATGGTVYIHKGNADEFTIQRGEMISPFLNHKFDIEVKRLDKLEKINGKWTQPAVIVKNKNTE